VIWPGPRHAAQRLLGRPPGEISALAEWPDHSAYRVDIAGDFFVVKIDRDHERIAREVAGQSRAALAGVPVPPIIAHEPGALAMRFVDGTPLNERTTAPAWRATGAALRTLHASSPEHGDELIGSGFGVAARTWPDFVHSRLESSLDGCVDGLGLDPAVAASIRRAFDDHLPLIEAAPIVRSHGDFQPEHVLLDPRSDQVGAIIDWADHGLADPAWDLAVLTLDDSSHLEDLFAGYGSPSTTGVDIRSRRTLYSVLRLLAEAIWFAEREHTEQAGAAVERATIWRAPNPN
jgi:aminoglycoside phosphotransferase (APT) family kinase protein